MSTTHTTSAATTPKGTASSAHRKLTLVQPESGHTVQLTLGYDLPVAVLGPIPLLLKGHWKLALSTLVATLALPLLGQVLLAKYTVKMRVKELLGRGYRAQGEQPGDVSAAEWTLGMSLPRLKSHRSQVSHAQLARK